MVKAIEQNDMPELKSELGDLLLQVVFHAQMASEEHIFTFEDIAQSIGEKMVRRHPHVFGDKVIKEGEAVHADWEKIKAEERADKQSDDTSILADVPNAFPSLIRAQKLQKRVARVGFDWPDEAPIVAKVLEELEEVKTATSPSHRAEEIGDLLFAVVNLARFHGVEAEEALRTANKKFESRFRFIEGQISDIESATLEEMETAWQAAKHKEKAA